MYFSSLLWLRLCYILCTAPWCQHTYRYIDTAHNPTNLTAQTHRHTPFRQFKHSELIPFFFFEILFLYHLISCCFPFLQKLFPLCADKKELKKDTSKRKSRFSTRASMFRKIRARRTSCFSFVFFPLFLQLDYVSLYWKQKKGGKNISNRWKWYENSKWMKSQTINEEKQPNNRVRRWDVRRNTTKKYIIFLLQFFILFLFSFWYYSFFSFSSLVVFPFSFCVCVCVCRCALCEIYICIFIQLFMLFIVSQHTHTHCVCMRHANHFFHRLMFVSRQL